MKRSCKPRSYLLCAYLILSGSLLMLPSVAVSSESLTPEQINSAQQTVLLKGLVTDKDGEPLVGVTIENKTAQKSVLTDIDGKYSISAKTGDVLSFRYIGMRTVEATLKQGQTTLDIVLETDENILDDVVVTGYQTISKERATGSYSILTSKNLENKTETNLISRIEGLVPGMSQDQDGSTIIRGVASIQTATRGVLYIVDNIPYEGAIGYINPNDVANITVLKDAAAASIYGARAANGVVVITTKKGQKGKIKVNYSGNIHFRAAPSLDHLNLMNSEEYVDYLKTAYNTVTPQNVKIKDSYNSIDLTQRYLDPVRTALVMRDKGQISEDELNSRLSYYSSLDNRDQIYDAFTRTAVVQQHNFNVSGGSDNYTFYMSLNYLEDNPNDKYVSSKQYSFNSKNEFKVTSKLKIFANLSGSFSSRKTDNYESASYAAMLQTYPSYYMLRDEAGDLVPFPSKSSLEYTYLSAERIQNLKNLGLKDMTYYPTEDMGMGTQQVNSDYLRVQGGFNWNIIDGLTASATYQHEITNGKTKIHYLEDSYYMRSRINDAAKINATTGVITYNIPLGGRMESQRSDSRAYTLRGQLDYKKTLKDTHYITALAGAERRAKRYISNNGILLGYKENGMLWEHVNLVPLASLSGTQSLSGNYKENLTSKVSTSDTENRYVSFYGNASYSYKRRYDLSGSIRVDESNLFGRMPENKYRPSWSVGTAWHLTNESFLKDESWLDRLVLRLTYGTGGVIATDATPYENVVNSGALYNTKVVSTYIKTPANPMLRWEKTYTKNIGLDFSVLNSRISGSIEYYKKKSVDLLGEKAGDPTVGWANIKVNYGKIDNEGYELALNVVPVKSRVLTWRTDLTYGYNKNKLKELEKVYQKAENYLSPEVLVIGKPLQSLFSTRYAGLNNQGVPMFYNANDEVVTYESLTKDDFVYSGTRMPKSTIGLTNTFSFKDFDFSFKLMYYGGHVMRDCNQQALTGNEDANFNKASLYFWKNPGDELDPSNPELLNLDISPAIEASNKMSTWRQGWISRDRNIKKADYIKLRNVNMTYRVPRTFLNRFKIESMALTFQINDLWWWAANGNIDPESYFYTGGSYYLSTQSKPNYSFNVNINF